MGGFQVCHRASKEWSKYLLFQARSTSVSERIHLTEVYTPQLQLHPSFVLHHYIFGGSLSFSAMGLTCPATLLGAPPRSPQPGSGLSPKYKAKKSAAEAASAHQINLSCLHQRKGAGQMDVSWGTRWSTGTRLDYVSSSSTWCSELRQEDGKCPQKLFKQHRKMTYLFYLTPASKL